MFFMFAQQKHKAVYAEMPRITISSPLSEPSQNNGIKGQQEEEPKINVKQECEL